MTKKHEQSEEAFVSKVVAGEVVAVYCVMESPEMWAFGYSDEMEEVNAAGMASLPLCYLAG